MFIFEQLLPIFAQTVLPVFLVALAGFVLARMMPIDGRSLGRVLFYLFTPSLVFRSLYQLSVDAVSVQWMVLVATSVTICAGALGWLVAAGEDRQRRIGIVLTSAISNNGNMGMPICLFAFGQPGLALATIYYVVISFLTNTLGVVVASSGSAPLGRSLLQALRVPVLYAAMVGLLLNYFDLTLPAGVFRAVDLMANAAIPGMLVLLGIQLHSAPMLQRQSIVARSVAVRLLAAPLIALAITTLLSISGLERDVLIVQAAMPTAVITSVVATEYNVAPGLVATVIFVCTAISMVTLSLILSILL
jgi:predicted permease